MVRKIEPTVYSVVNLKMAAQGEITTATFTHFVLFSLLKRARRCKERLTLSLKKW